MLNLTRLHLGIAHESQFQGLGITGSPSAHAGAFTSRPPLRHGSIRSSGSSRSSPSSRSSEERINRSQSWRRPSTPSSTLAMRTPLRSNGPNPPTTSWLLSSASAAELSQSTQKLNRNFGIGTLDRVRRVGVLMGHAESDPQAQSEITAFRQGLQKLGWTGRNIG